MKRYRTHILPMLLTLILLVAGCTNSKKQMKRLAQIDSLMEKNPQAAYDSLCRNQKEMTQGGARQVEMRHRLLMAKAENKLYKPMPSDSAFQDVVDYYDVHGTANEKMQSHYLMGCIFRDQEEAPKAIQYFEKAIALADTLNKECDYGNVSRIYGQMAELYRKQYLHQEAINACQKYSDFAARDNDVSAFVDGLYQISSEYYEMGDTTKAIQLIFKVNKLYKKYGMYKEATQVYPRLIYTYLNRAQYRLAHNFMRTFEKESGLFDVNHNIQHGWEHYYKAKAMYYLGVEQIDSAEFYYRKLGKFGFKLETSQGLLSVYCSRNSIDSIEKYSSLCEQEMDKILNSRQFDAIKQASSLFNYTRLQSAIDEQALKGEREKLFLSIVVFIVLAFFCVFCQIYRKRQERMADKVEQLNSDYLRTLKALKRAHLDLETFQSDKEKYIEQKQEEIVVLKSELERLRGENDKMGMVYKKRILRNSEIVRKIKSQAFLCANGDKISKRDWEDLKISFQRWHPLLFERLNNGVLSEQEFDVCMLTYLGFNNKLMAFILNTSSNVICNAKQKANSKLFGDKKASSLNKNMLKI